MHCAMSKGMVPQTPEGFFNNPTYYCFLVECAIGAFDPFDFDKLTLRAEELVPFVFNAAYDDDEIRKHYLQAQAIVKDWLHDVSADTLETLLCSISPRPLACSRKNTNPEVDKLKPGLHDVLGIVSKYQFQYRRPYLHNTEADSDTWGRPLATKEPPENLTCYSLCVAPDDFGDAWALLPCGMFKPESAIGNRVCSLLAKSLSLDKFYTRTVVGVSFPYFLWTFRKCQTALAIEHAWLTLPLIRQGKPGRGTNAGRANQLHSQWRQDKKESRSSSWGAGHWQESQSWSDGHWRRSWR